MHKKEKELLAVLALILSIAFWVATMYPTANKPITTVAKTSDSDLSKSTNISMVGQITPTQDYTKLRNDSKDYTDKILVSLVEKQDYSSVYNSFDEEIKFNYFKNDKEEAFKTFKDFIGYIGKTSDFYLSNQSLNSSADSMINYYVVTASNEKNNKTMLVGIEVYIKIANNNFSLHGFKSHPI